MTNELVTIQSSLPDKITFARALSDSSLLPPAYRQQPANILLALELGAALDIAPIIAINEVNVINGSPSLSASLMQALARKAGHKVRVTGDDTQATCVIVRADDPDFEHTATWDEAKARKSGLWGKGHWAKDPGLMLKWRAISECVRIACSEVLGGIKYTPEEAAEMAPSHTVTQVPDVAPPAKPPTLKEAVESHKITHEDDPWSQPKPPADTRTDAQSKKLFALMRELDMNNRDEALAYFGGLIGRQIESTKDLTVAEASTVIDTLESAKKDKADPITGVVEAELVDEADSLWPASEGLVSAK